MTGEIGSIYGPRIPTTRARIDFWHGVDWSRGWDSVWGLVQQRQRWVKARFGDAAFEDKPLADGFSAFDLEDGGHSLAEYGDSKAGLLSERDQKKMSLLLAQQIAEHDEHHFVQLRPFCPTCRRSKYIAGLSLASWLTRHPGRVPPNPSDTELGWDTDNLVEPPIADQASLYLTTDQLASMPMPVELIRGVLPQKGVGYITGRDRSLKTFLALDVCLHVATMQTRWHAAGRDGEQADRREMDWGSYGTVLYAAGEGVSSFWPRIQAWERAQHVRTPDGSCLAADDSLAIRVEDCPACEAELDPQVGHVSHPAGTGTSTDDYELRLGFGDLERENVIIRRGTVNLFEGGEDFRYMLALARKMRPDVIVLDTLALSAGAADQQSNSEMGQVHMRAAALAEASDGLVIIIAHTDKGDNDARGASLIEDNSDFVLHCNRESNEQLVVTVAKRKDAEDNWQFKLQVQEVPLDEFGMTSSLILRDWDGSLDAEAVDPEPTDEEKGALKVAQRLVIQGQHNAFTVKAFAFESGVDVSAKTVRNRLDSLVAKGVLLRRDPEGKGRGQKALYYFPTDWMVHAHSLGHEIADIDETHYTGDRERV